MNKLSTTDIQPYIKAKQTAIKDISIKQDNPLFKQLTSKKTDNLNKQLQL